ncbi:MAG: hypothetical protein WD556_01645 [Actinomycetota bacterium]
MEAHPSGAVRRGRARRGFGRGALVLAAATLAIATLPGTATGGAAAIGVDDDFFDPDESAYHSPAPFPWNWQDTENAHTVRQNKMLFSSGAPRTGNHQFVVRASSGTFPYYCSVHGSPGGGMRGRIRVGIRIEEIDEEHFRVRWAFSDSETGNVYDVRYRVGSGKWKNWKVDTKQRAVIFGRNDQPVAVDPATTYRFRARSQAKASTPKQVSGWSPVRERLAALPP